MWFFLSCLTLIFLAAHRVIEKDFVTKNPINPFRLHWMTQAVGLPFVAAVIVANFHTITELPLKFWITLAVVVIGYYPLVAYLYLQTIRVNDLSSILPLLSMIPAFTILFGWLLLHQTPSLLGLIGVGFISASIYVLHLRPNLSWSEPIVNILRSKAAKAMAVVSVVTALAAIGDKFAIDNSSAFIYMALNMLGAVGILLAADLILNRQKCRHIKRELQTLKGRPARRIVVLGILLLIIQVSSFTAIALGPVTGYVVAIRNLSIVLASLIAIWLFKEQFNRYKCYSYALSTVGLVLIAL